MENHQTAPEITGIDALYARWTPSHPGMTKEHFRAWLSAPSQEREIFLLENTTTTHTVIDNTVITQSSAL